ncbi:MAG: acyl carrier protein [Oscillospiraceae bacterium]|jgi:acyl carrier protein|nr:acyl carrier protein [Oscillospiraceae bacterium]
MLNKIISYLSQQLDISPDSMDANTTFESLNLDSLDMAEMIIDMEEEVGVDFEIDGELRLETIGELADYIEDKLG